jgi:hypothetical protein
VEGRKFPRYEICWPRSGASNTIKPPIAPIEEVGKAGHNIPQVREIDIQILVLAHRPVPVNRIAKQVPFLVLIVELLDDLLDSGQILVVRSSTTLLVD